MSKRNGSTQIIDSTPAIDASAIDGPGNEFRGADTDAEIGRELDQRGDVAADLGGLAPAGAPARPKRGRPSNAEKAARASLGGEEAPVKQRRQYTRRAPDGDGGKPEKPMTATSAEGILRDIHRFTFEVALKIPDLAPSDTETKELAKAFVNMAKHFPSIQLDPKYEKWVALGMFGFVAFKVYAPRVAIVSALVKAQKAAKMGQMAHSDLKPNGNQPATAGPDFQAFNAH